MCFEDLCNVEVPLVTYCGTNKGRVHDLPVTGVIFPAFASSEEDDHVRHRPEIRLRSRSTRRTVLLCVSWLDAAPMSTLLFGDKV